MMTAKTKIVTLRMTPDTWSKLDMIAQSQRRPTASLIRIILEDAAADGMKELADALGESGKAIGCDSEEA